MSDRPPLLPPEMLFPMFSAKQTCDLYGTVLVVGKEGEGYKIVKPTDFSIVIKGERTVGDLVREVAAEENLALSVLRKIVNDKYAYIGITDDSLIFDGQVNLTPEESALLKTLEES